MSEQQLGVPNFLSEQEIAVLRTNAQATILEQKRDNVFKFLTTEYEQKDAVNLFIKEGWGEEVKNNRAILDNEVLAIQSLGLFKEKLSIKKQREEFEAQKAQLHNTQQQHTQQVNEPVNTQSIRPQQERITRLRDLDLSHVQGFKNDDERTKMRLLLDVFGG